MSRNAVLFLVGLACVAVLAAIIVMADQSPAVVAIEATAIGLLTYALTFTVRPRGSDDDRREIEPLE